MVYTVILDAKGAERHAGTHAVMRGASWRSDVSLEGLCTENHAESNQICKLKFLYTDGLAAVLIGFMPLER